MARDKAGPRPRDAMLDGRARAGRNSGGQRTGTAMVPIHHRRSAAGCRRTAHDVGRG